jgi:hypothetical protein
MLHKCLLGWVCSGGRSTNSEASFTSHSARANLARPCPLQSGSDYTSRQVECPVFMGVSGCCMTVRVFVGRRTLVRCTVSTKLANGSLNKTKYRVRGPSRGLFGGLLWRDLQSRSVKASANWLSATATTVREMRFGIGHGLLRLGGCLLIIGRHEKLSHKVFESGGRGVA